MSTPTWLSDIKAIGWDLDGTLYPADAIPWRLIEDAKYEQVASQNNWTPVKAKKHFDDRLQELGSNTKTLTSLGVDGEQFFTDIWDTIELDQYIQEDKQLSSLINQLNRQGYRQFILSNSNRLDQIKRKLALIGIDPNAFEVIVSTVGLDAVKPQPEPFIEVIKQLSTRQPIQPSQILYIGDRVSTDILGASGVGMRTCLVGKESPKADISHSTTHQVAEIFLASQGGRHV